MQRQWRLRVISLLFLWRQWRMLAQESLSVGKVGDRRTLCVRLYNGTLYCCWNRRWWHCHLYAWSLLQVPDEASGGSVELLNFGLHNDALLLQFQYEAPAKTLHECAWLQFGDNHDANHSSRFPDWWLHPQGLPWSLHPVCIDPPVGFPFLLNIQKRTLATQKRKSRSREKKPRRRAWSARQQGIGWTKKPTWWAVNDYGGGWEQLLQIAEGP